MSKKKTTKTQAPADAANKAPKAKAAKPRQQCRRIVRRQQ